MMRHLVLPVNDLSIVADKLGKEMSHSKSKLIATDRCRIALSLANI